MKKRILIVLALFISVITHSQNIQSVDLKGTEKSVIITFAAKGDVIQASYQVGGNPENRPHEQMSLNFLGATRSQIMLENAWICNMLNTGTGVSTTLKAAGKDKFTIPNDLAAGTYNFLLNDKLIATNYKVQ